MLPPNPSPWSAEIQALCAELGALEYNTRTRRDQIRARLNELTPQENAWRTATTPPNPALSNAPLAAHPDRVDPDARFREMGFEK